MRKRLSWDAEKVAELEKQADPYTMNQDHKNNDVKKYDVGGPAEFGETPDMKTPWQGEGRNEVGFPKAVKAARILEDKALKCITIAQRMLPGASDDMIEKQATDLMYLPEDRIINTLQRQASLAEVLAGKKCEEDEEEEVAEEKKEEKVEEKAAPVVEAKKEEVEEKKEEVPAVVEAKKEEVEEKKEEVPVVEAKKEEKEEKVPEGEEVEASVDLLDQIFANEMPKAGAKKLSGIVKQASMGDSNSLDNLWNAPPDVSEAFR